MSTLACIGALGVRVNKGENDTIAGPQTVEPVHPAVEDTIYRASVAAGTDWRLAKHINPDEEDELYERDQDDELGDRYAPPSPDEGERGSGSSNDDEELS